MTNRNRDNARTSHACNVRDGQEYCGDACRDAGSEDVEIACQCDLWRAHSRLGSSLT